MIIKPRRRCSRRVDRGRSRHLGLSTIETIVTLPIIIILVAAVYEYIRIKQTGVTVEHAALMAARQGAVESADPAALRNGLARGLAPLYATRAVAQNSQGGCFDGSGDTSACLDQLDQIDNLGASARDLAMAEITSNFGEAVILNPTVEHFQSMALASGPEVQGDDTPYLPNAGLQRRHMEEPSSEVVRTRTVVDQVTKRRSTITDDEFVEWLRGNGHAAGVPGWNLDVPVLEDIQPDYRPGVCYFDEDLGDYVDGSDGTCNPPNVAIGSVTTIWPNDRWPDGNNANGDNHEFDVDHFADLARQELSGGNQLSDISDLTRALDRMVADADEIVVTECTRRGPKGNCWPNRWDTDGPELYQQAWLDYFSEMRANLDEVSTPYTEDVVRTVEYTDHTQPTRGDIQDANLLEVLVIYGYKPVVPLPWLSDLLGDIGRSEAQTASTRRFCLYIIRDGECGDYGPTGQWRPRPRLNSANNSSTNDGFLGYIHDQWSDEYDSGSDSGDGYDLIRQAARTIIANNRVPIMRTAVVRMQSPVIASEHMLRVNSSYFTETVPSPPHMVNPAAQNPGFDEWPEPAVDNHDDVDFDGGPFTLQECNNADSVLRYAGEDDFDPDSDGAAYELLRDMGLWSNDDMAQTSNNFDMLKNACGDLHNELSDNNFIVDFYLQPDEWVAQLPEEETEPVIPPEATLHGSGGADTLAEGCYTDASVRGSWSEPSGPWPEAVEMNEATRVTFTFTPDGCTRCGTIEREYTEDRSNLPGPAGIGYDLTVCVSAQ